ncbi:MAG: hypothetical protein SFY66_06225 [Oculatellaceae cyanobacterium bins.114]|nr:hypothetical protein [Oculatellaceae cyanobacterium bins.114]
MQASNFDKLIQRTAHFIEQWIKPLFQCLIYLRVQTAIALAAWLVFSQVEQAIEVYRSIALDNNLYQACVTTVFVAILTIFIWYTSRFLVLEEYNNCPKNKCQNFLATWAPRSLGIAPMLGLSFGIFEAWKQSINVAVKAFLMTWMTSSLIVGGLILLLFITRTVLFNQLFLGSKSQGTGLFDPKVEIGLANSAYIVFSAFSLPLVAAATNSKFSLGIITILLFSALLNAILYSWHIKQKLDPDYDPTLDKTIIRWFIISLVTSIIFVLILPPTGIPNLVGAIGVVAVSFTILVVVFSTIYTWALRNRIPALTILIGLVILSSVFNFNDNHQFRQSINSQNPPILSLENSFKQWLASRPDRDQYSGKPYPVYIASAQGGGIFAAYHAATAFAKLTEYFPSFPQHIFAISGVSGGSLGASTFASLIKESDGNNQILSRRASQIFEQDLLSPLLTFGLFPDLVQRFIPFSIYDWDRASGLEVAFENAWNNLPNTNRENPFKRSFYQHWQPNGIAPALVLNTTVVESGKRLVISPFKIELPTGENIALDESNLDLRLSTAAGLSARFPFVTPVGWYKHSNDGSKSRLADGGYFDNSGIPTSIDIGRTLQKIEGNGKTFKLIYLAIVDQPGDGSIQPLKSSGLNEILSPIRVLFSARGARSSSAIELSTYTLNDGITDPFKLNFRTLMLQKVNQAKQIKLPLGWELATTSKEFIEQQTPNPSQCNVEEFKQAFSRNASSRITAVRNAKNYNVENHNSCVAQSIKTDLS